MRSAEKTGPSRPMANEPRRLSPPWEVVEHRESFQVKTANGLTISFTYFEDSNPTRRFEMGRLTKDEARRVAANIAKLPELLKKESWSRQMRQGRQR
jgi:hypothetical protein